MELNSEVKQSDEESKVKNPSFPMRKRHQMIGRVDGTVEITISDSKANKTGSSRNPFFHYNGGVRSGDDDAHEVEATILVFDDYQEEEIERLHDKLNLLSHPFIIRSLGYEYGSQEYTTYFFLALSRFDATFAAYMEKTCKRTMKLGRFTEEVIAIIGCVVQALLKLHDCGFYCPKLSGRNIAIVKENTGTRAMLFDFHLLGKGNENGKDNDWVRLGSMLRRTAENHGSLSPEIDDLCINLENGTLKGMDILKQSALLTVRKKFQNVLSLSTFILTHYPQTTQQTTQQTTELPNNIPKLKLNCKTVNEDDINATEQLHCNSSDEAKEIALKSLLFSDVGWTSAIPSWISKKITDLQFSLPTDNSFKEFVWRIRCLIEHENQYLVKDTKKISFRHFQYDNEETDLEHEIRKAWSFLFLNCQKFATILGLNY